jgi:dephospho-CoA kinase
VIVLGLTGSIAMGKSTTAKMFAAEGAAVYDADAAVHALYAPGGLAGARLAPVFPQAVTEDGAVRRDVLRHLLADAPDSLSLLEAEVFPLLAEQRQDFLATAVAGGRRLAVLDIPLLFETGADAAVDAVVVVTAAPEVQRARVMARDGMDEATFAILSARQTPDQEKRRRADFLVFTDNGLQEAAFQVHRIVQTVLAPGWTPPGRRGAKSSEVSDIMDAKPGARG